MGRFSDIARLLSSLLILFIVSLVFISPPVKANCWKRGIITCRVIPPSHHCDDEGLDYMCCDTEQECIANSPFCNGNPESIKTALGCLNAQPTGWINQVVTWSVGLAAGVAFLLLVYAGFTITTAGGNPKRVAEGREMIVSVVIGLFLIVCAIIILNTIGLAFNLPNLGFSI